MGSRGKADMLTSIHDLPAVELVRKRHRIDSYRLRQLRNVFCKKHGDAEAALAQLPDEVRERFAAEVEFHALTLESRHDSQLDGATKLVFRTSQNNRIESVILRLASGRTALCVVDASGLRRELRFLRHRQDGHRPQSVGTPRFSTS